MEWTYHRGHWTSSPDYIDDARTLLAKDRLKKWARQRRWQKFPSLGPVPEKWMDVGPPPVGPAAYMSECLTAYYLGPIREMLNAPSPLLRFFR